MAAVIERRLRNTQVSAEPAYLLAAACGDKSYAPVSLDGGE